MALFGGDSSSNISPDEVGGGLGGGNLGGYYFVNDINVRAGNKQNTVTIQGDLNAQQEFTAIMKQLNSGEAIAVDAFKLALGALALYAAWRAMQWVLK